MKRFAWRVSLLVGLLLPGLLLAFPAELETFFQAIRQRESAGHPWSIFDNTAQRSYRLASRADAERVAAELVERGHSVDLGLFQVNWRWHRHRPGLALTNVFDPAVNENVARTIFSEFYTASRAIYSDADEAIRMAVGAYNNGKVRRHNPKYVNGVYRLARLPLPYADEHDGARVAAASPAPGTASAPPPVEKEAGSELARWFRGIPSLAVLLDWETNAEADVASNSSRAEDVVATVMLPLLLLALLVLGLIVLLKLAPIFAAGAGLLAKRIAVSAALGVSRRLAAQVNRAGRFR